MSPAASIWAAVGMLSVPAMAETSLPFLYTGLVLLIIGNGFFKPNISVIVGHLYEPGDPRKDSAFTIFYMGINVGAFFAPLLTGYMALTYGYRYGFLVAGIGMLIGLLVMLVLFGQDSGTGNKSWLRFFGIGIQPSELVKLSFVLLLARQLRWAKERQRGLSNLRTE